MPLYTYPSFYIKLTPRAYKKPKPISLVAEPPIVKINYYIFECSYKTSLITSPNP